MVLTASSLHRGRWRTGTKYIALKLCDLSLLSTAEGKTWKTMGVLEGVVSLTQAAQAGENYRLDCT